MWGAKEDLNLNFLAIKTLMAHSKNPQSRMLKNQEIYLKSYELV